eukprot:365444-Chlamydomonas_euryale.AAC.3
MPEFASRIALEARRGAPCRSAGPADPAVAVGGSGYFDQSNVDSRIGRTGPRAAAARGTR